MPQTLQIGAQHRLISPTHPLAAGQAQCRQKTQAQDTQTVHQKVQNKTIKHTLVWVTTVLNKASLLGVCLGLPYHPGLSSASSCRLHVHLGTHMSNGPSSCTSSRWSAIEGSSASCFLPRWQEMPHHLPSPDNHPCWSDGWQHSWQWGFSPTSLREMMSSWYKSSRTLVRTTMSLSSKIPPPRSEILQVRSQILLVHACINCMLFFSMWNNCQHSASHVVHPFNPRDILKFSHMTARSSNAHTICMTSAITCSAISACAFSHPASHLS